MTQSDFLSALDFAMRVRQFGLESGIVPRENVAQIRREKQPLLGGTAINQRR
jgi:hypothetical protein